MAINDAISDMMARIRNAQQARLSYTVSPTSRMRVNVLEVLKKEGYIRDYSETEEGGKKQLKIELKYLEGRPVIQSMTRLSKPGCRRYSTIESLRPYYNGLGITILSTSKGVVSDHEARKLNVGGELICQVF